MDLAGSETYFPFLDLDEREVTVKFCTSCDNPSSPHFENHLKGMLELMKRLYTALVQLPENSELRSIFRAKLMNIAGIYTLIPPHKVLAFIGKNYEKPEPFTLHPTFTSHPSFINQEISQKTLLSLPFFFPLVNLPKKGEEKYGDAIRDFCKSVIFCQDIKQETYARHYLTSTSEPLSQSIVLNLQDPQQKPRDLISLCIDIVYQSIFLKIFYTSPSLYKPSHCEQLARKEAQGFAQKALQLLKKNEKLKELQKNFDHLVNFSLAGVSG